MGSCIVKGGERVETAECVARVHFLHCNERIRVAPRDALLFHEMINSVASFLPLFSK